MYSVVSGFLGTVLGSLRAGVPRGAAPAPEAMAKKKDGAENINTRLALVMRSGTRQGRGPKKKVCAGSCVTVIGECTKARRESGSVFCGS